jgi:hypothetical protein
MSKVLSYFDIESSSHEKKQTFDQLYEYEFYSADNFWL